MTDLETEWGKHTNGITDSCKELQRYLLINSWQWKCSDLNISAIYEQRARVHAPDVDKKLVQELKEAQDTSIKLRVRK